MSHLFCLECEFNENLLQLFVDIVDAELLKAILLEDLKTVDVQDSNVHLQPRPLHCLVHRLKQHAHITLHKQMLSIAKVTLLSIVRSRQTLLGVN